MSCCLLSTFGGSFIAHAQDLGHIVQDLRPALYLNNMDNQRVYRESLMNNHHLIFSKNFFHRAVTQNAESYHYHLLHPKCATHVLECRFHHHAVPIGTDEGLQAVPFCDFGIQIYALDAGVWTDRTAQLLPADFETQLLEQFSGLQASGLAYFYYNQDPEQLVSIVYHKRKLHFKINHQTVLCLKWKRNRFVWKHSGR